jgi:hypothetical protein
MRDVNDDLSKQPFNEEMKEIARRFASLVKPIIDTGASAPACIVVHCRY